MHKAVFPKAVLPFANFVFSSVFEEIWLLTRALNLSPASCSVGCVFLIHLSDPNQLVHIELRKKSTEKSHLLVVTKIVCIKFRMNSESSLNAKKKD